MRLDLMNIEVLKGDFKVRWLTADDGWAAAKWMVSVSKYSKQTCGAIALDGKRGYDIMNYHDIS